jgi:DNA-binding NarL/FixJ family response regulator
VPIDVVLADDHPIVLAGLETLFGRVRDIAVVASCSDGVAALQAVQAYRPDVLVLDFRMPRLDGLGVLRALHRDKVKTRAILLAVNLDRAEMAEAIRLGVRGIVLKEMAPAVIVKCVREVYAGKQWLDPPAGAATADRAHGTAATAQAMEALTPRELEVVRAVGEGLRNKEIAEKLSITEGTVKIHLHAVYDKLKLDGRTALILQMKALGLL